MPTHTEAPVLCPNQGPTMMDSETTWRATQPPLVRFFRRSRLTGRFHMWDLPATGEQVFRWKNMGVFAQDAFVSMSPEQREFVISGTTPDEWKTMLNVKED